MTPDYTGLAAFRYSIRRFLKSGEDALAEANVEPQQYQCLLAIKARAVNGEIAGISDLAEILLLTHHACVGLIDRMEARGLVQRCRDRTDARRVHVVLTELGEAAVEKLARVHQAQLQVLGPGLILALTRVIDTVQDREEAID